MTRAALVVAVILGAATALAIAPHSGAEGPGNPCQANEDATTLTGVTYTGSAGAETIQGSDDDNVIYGRGGDDVICAYRGDDRVYGGKGRDRLRGEADDDRLLGGPQADVLLGGNGEDICKGGTPTGGGDPDSSSGCETTSGTR